MDEKVGNALCICSYIKQLRPSRTTDPAIAVGK